MTKQCKAKNTTGEPCGAAPVDGSDYCFMHDPNLAKESAEARKKGGYNRRRVKSSDPEQPVRIQSAQDVLSLVERAVADTLALENSVARSRTIGYLAGVALKAHEVGELERRLAALEAQTKLRYA